MDSKMLYAAAKIHWSFNGDRPKFVDQYGMRLISDDIDECRQYIREHRGEFLEMNGYYFPAVIRFDPTKCPKTMEYHRTSPSLHIASGSDGREDIYLASCIVERG